MLRKITNERVAHRLSRTQAFFAIEHRTQEVVGVDMPFHQHLRLTAPQERNRFRSGVRIVRRVDEAHALQIESLLERNSARSLHVSDANEAHETFSSSL